MSQQPVEANVVLTADTSDYQQNMAASAQQTDQMGKSVDSLSAKIDRLTKSAGKKMLGFAAVDVAGITAATTAYGAFQNQMASLSAQAAVMNRQMDAQKATFGSYTASVNKMRSEFSVSTSEAVALQQVLSKISDNTVPVDKLANTFIKMGNATGESSVQLAQAMTSLGRSMGTPQKDIEKYANQVTVLATRSNTSAESIANFANQLAPIGRAAGMTQTDLQGVSSAFARAGQDGFTAANGFSKMMSDITMASKTGAPNLAIYSNLVGMTVGQFKELGGTDQYLKVIDALNRQGPSAITTLSRMGYDGIRMQKSIAALAQQGGVGQDIMASRNADADAIGRGSKASMATLAHELQHIRTELTQTAEAFGSMFAGPAAVFLKTMGLISGVVKDVASGPLGQMAATVMKIAAPFAAVAAAIMLASKALLAWSAANQLLRNSFTYGFREARSTESAVARASGAAPFVPGRVGEAIEKRGNFVNRFLYKKGAATGVIVPGGNTLPGGEKVPLWSRGVGYAGTGAGWAARELVGMQYSAGSFMGANDPTMRWRLFNAKNLGDYKFMGGPGLEQAGTAGPNTVSGRVDAGASALRARVAKFGTSTMSAVNAGGQAILLAHGYQPVPNPAGPVANPAGPVANPAGPAPVAGPVVKPKVTYEERLATAQAGQAEKVAKDAETAAKVEKSAKALGTVEKEAMTASRGMGAFARGLGSLSLMIGSAGAGLGRSIGGLLGNNPLLIGGAAAFAGYEAIKFVNNQGHYVNTDYSNGAKPYLDAGGVQGSGRYSPQYSVKSVPSVKAALHVSTADIRAGHDPSFKLTNSNLKGMTKEQALTTLSANWPQISKSKESLQKLNLDLVHQYGADAQGMLNTLSKGGGFDASSYMKTVVDPGRENWHSVGPSETKSSDAAQKLMGAYGDQVDYAAINYGQKAATQLESKQSGQVLKLFADQAGVGINRQGGRNAHDPMENQRTAFGLSYAKQFLGLAGQDALTKEQAAAFTYSQSASPAEAERKFLENNIFSTQSGVAKDARTTDKQREDILEKYNLDKKGLNTESRYGEAVNAVLQAQGGNGLDTDGHTYLDRIRTTNGGDVMTGKYATLATTTGIGDANIQIKAVKEMYNTLVDLGKTAPQITKIFGDIKAQSKGDSSDPNYGLADMAQQYAQRQQGYAMPGMTRTQQFGAQMDQYRAVMSVQHGDPDEQKNQQAATDQMESAKESQRQYFQSMLNAQQQLKWAQARAQEDFALSRSRGEFDFNLQRQRAQDDFHQQEKWQLEDFNLSRGRAEEDFARQRGREVFNYNLQNKRAQADFHTSRMRDQQDYQHQIQLMTEQMSSSYADITQRIAVQRTASTGWLLFNADEQLKTMKDQKKNLNTLRKDGLSDKAIQAWHLTDSSQAQQLQRTVTDLTGHPELVAKMNKAAKDRLGAAGDLATDKSSKQWQEMERSHNLSLTRAQQDFNKQMGRGREDFHRSLDQQDEDFGRSMDRQAADFEKSQNRSEHMFTQSMSRSAADFARSEKRMVTDFGTQMDRGQQDLERMAETIDGNFEHILALSVKRLGGHARKQAQTVLDEFNGTKDNATTIAGDTMKEIAAIYGVKYVAPATVASAQGRKNQQAVSDLHNAEGGVLPGFTPGQDVHHFVSADGRTNLHLSGGEAIMRPEWTKAVGGPKAVEEMNHNAKHGLAFAGGGIMPRIAGAQNFARGEVGKPYMWGKVGPLGYDCSGFMSAITNWLEGNPIHQRVGSTGTFPWRGFLPGPGAFTIGATRSYNGGVGHMAGTLGGLNVESRGGQGVVVGDSARGYKDPGFNMIYHLGDSGDFGYGGGAGGATNFSSLKSIKKRYPHLEAHVARMKGIHAFKPGQASTMMNRMAVIGWNNQARKHHGQNIRNVKDLFNMIAMGDMAADGMSAAMSTGSGGKAVWDALTSSGMSEAQAAGVMGNMLTESSLDPHRVQGGGDSLNPDHGSSVGYGLVQWTGGAKLKSYIGKAIPTINNEVDALQKQLHGLGAYPESAAGAMLRAANSPESAANAFLKHYERPKDSNQPARAKQARDYYTRFAGKHGDGAVFAQGMQNINVGERGPEMVLPLNDRGVNFLEALMSKYTSGNDGRGSHATHCQPAASHTYNNYQIDKSTNFTGAITVQANDPNQMLGQLRQRARTQALRQPAIGGSRV